MAPAGERGSAPGVCARPAAQADVPALTRLQERWDTAWFGSPENDESELRQSFDRVDPLDARSRVVDGPDGEIVAAAWWWAPNETTLLVDPAVDPGPLHDLLLPWLRSSGAAAVEALGRDTALREALAGHGWQHELSSFELIREVSPDWSLAAPRWPDDVTVSSVGPDDDPDAYRVVYDGAAWAQVPGHERRSYDEWRSLFLGVDVLREQQVLVRRRGRAVGVALGRTFSDGTGWVSQLAVAREQQGAGLGRAMLLEAFRRRVAGGARQLGLGVSAQNADALRLYLDVGLRVDREWLRHRPG